MVNADKKLSNIFDALGSKHRRDIVHMLSLQPASITQLANKQKLSLPAIHKHIKILEKAKLIQRKKSGRCNFLALNQDALVDLKKWVDQYHAYWGSPKNSLENYVKGIEKG